MSVEFDRGSPGKFDSRTLNRKTLSRWTGRMTTTTTTTTTTIMITMIIINVTGRQRAHGRLAIPPLRGLPRRSYTHTYVCMYVYIYIERERDR